ncbi:hypothetical protein BC628DRAFT_215110 [Trametes gibbosa]|nr:hypothetical protein BC628DRAFT_215110 [Trametes gibbosa]
MNASDSPTHPRIQLMSGGNRLATAHFPLEYGRRYKEQVELRLETLLCRPPRANGLPRILPIASVDVDVPPRMLCVVSAPLARKGTRPPSAAHVQRGTQVHPCPEPAHVVLAVPRSYCARLSSLRTYSGPATMKLYMALGARVRAGPAELIHPRNVCATVGGGGSSRPLW